jgi:hypothetical protein
MRKKDIWPAESGPTSVSGACATGQGPRAGTRSSTTPAYYLGRPAGFWLDLFGRTRPGGASADDRTPPRERGDAATRRAA